MFSKEMYGYQWYISVYSPASGNICLNLLQEASELSRLKPELDQLGVPLYGVVKEKIGEELSQFQPYFKGDIFLDEKVLMFFYSFFYCFYSVVFVCRHFK